MEKLLEKHHFCNLQVSPKKLYCGGLTLSETCGKLNFLKPIHENEHIENLKKIKSARSQSISP